MFRQNIIRLIILLCCCVSIFILKSCSLPNKSTIYSVVSPNLGFNTTESILKSRIYYINGLATAKDDAERNLDRIIAAIGGNEVWWPVQGFRVTSQNSIPVPFTG